MSTQPNPIRVRLEEAMKAELLAQAIGQIASRMKFSDNPEDATRGLAIRNILYSNFQRQVTRNISWSVGLVGRDNTMKFLENVMHAIKALDEDFLEDVDFFFEATIETAVMTSSS